MNDLIEQLNGILPAKYVTYALLAWVVAQAIGRGYQAIIKRQGLLGVWRALIYGTNTPKNGETE